MLYNRVQETSTTTGTGSLTLAGAVTGYHALDGKVPTGTLVSAAIEHETANEFEYGWYTFTSPSTLARTRVLGGSNGASAVNFSAGTKRVLVTPLADSFGSRVLFAGVGPAASSPSTSTDLIVLTIPANTLRVGDALRITAHMLHTGTANAPRYGVRFGGTLVQSEGNGVATEAREYMEISIGIIGANSQIARGFRQRQQGSVINFTSSEPAENVTVAIDIDFTGNFNASTADTLRIAQYTVEHLYAVGG